MVRLVGFVALVALAAAGLALAVFCIGTGTSGPSLGHLAKLVHLESLRGTVGQWLGQMETPGSVAVLAVACGIGAIRDQRRSHLSKRTAPRSDRTGLAPRESDQPLAARNEDPSPIIRWI